MKRALVTGGSGFLGSHICDALTRRGVEVVLFDAEPARHPLLEGQRQVLGDICDAECVAEAARGAHYIFHLAALADLNVAAGRPAEAARVNILGTVNVLEAARAAGVERFLFASTVYVYSRAGGFYRCSKQAGEAYVEEYRRQFELPYTILRYGSLYGPRADASNGVYRLLRQAVTDGRVEVTGRPEDAREYVHVEDAATLSVDVLAPEFADENLVITGPHPMRLGDLMTMFSEILGREVEVDFRQPETGGGDVHYRITPYSFQPRTGRKLTSNCYVDMGQGILQMLEELQAAGAGR